MNCEADCPCVKCRVARAERLTLARQEELAGREEAYREATRPTYWRPRPGTRKAIDRRYTKAGTERKAS